MFSLFKKKNEGEAFDAKKIEMLLGFAKSMGFDVYKKIEEAMPKLLAAYLGMEHQAASRLMLVLTVADDSSHFVVSQYALQADGTAVLRRSFPLNDVPALIERLKSALSEEKPAENDPHPAPQSIATAEQPRNAAHEPQPGDPAEPDPYDFGASFAASRQQPEQPGQ